MNFVLIRYCRLVQYFAADNSHRDHAKRVNSKSRTPLSGDYSIGR